MQVTRICEDHIVLVGISLMDIGESGLIFLNSKRFKDSIFSQNEQGRGSSIGIIRSNDNRPGGSPGGNFGLDFSESRRCNSRGFPDLYLSHVTGAGRFIAVFPKSSVPT
eukprot:TRINITY_DN3466_c0_g2_i1.p1 TRINITY_DN3466_c0_g2~~TRINITY_DN3466_c0_g2_i1.p1  ORF type:complete len:109 (-),score=3.27 TRINITY_DN3466_c0_g2_i1:10-336(-)